VSYILFVLSVVIVIGMVVRVFEFNTLYAGVTWGLYIVYALVVVIRILTSDRN